MPFFPHAITSVQALNLANVILLVAAFDRVYKWRVLGPDGDGLMWVEFYGYDEKHPFRTTVVTAGGVVSDAAKWGDLG